LHPNHDTGFYRGALFGLFSVAYMDSGRLLPLTADWPKEQFNAQFSAHCAATGGHLLGTCFFALGGRPPSATRELIPLIHQARVAWFSLIDGRNFFAPEEGVWAGAASTHARQLAGFGSSFGREVHGHHSLWRLLLADHMTKKRGDRGDREQLNASGKLVFALSLCAHTSVQHTAQTLHRKCPSAQLWL
jgi:hypothetical protein